MLSLRDSILSVIRSFYDDETRKVWQGESSKKLPSQIQAVARRKLRVEASLGRIRELLRRLPP
jgi:proteic killer suppression protein